MRNAYGKLVAHVTLTSLILITLTACGSSFGKRLEAATTARVQADAGTRLEDPPPDCVATEPDPALAVGTEARTAIRQFKRAKDRQNARTTRCLVHPGGWYKTYQRELAQGAKPDA